MWPRKIFHKNKTTLKQHKGGNTNKQVNKTTLKQHNGGNTNKQVNNNMS